MVNLTNVKKDETKKAGNEIKQKKEENPKAGNEAKQKQPKAAVSNSK